MNKALILRAAIGAISILGVLANYQTVNATETPSVEQRLQTLEDRAQIEQLLMRYAEAFNTNSADAYVGTFAPDGVLTVKLADSGKEIGPFKGRDALREQWFPNSKPGAGGGAYGPMRHVTTNIHIEVHGNTATNRAYFIEIVSNGPNTPPGSNPPIIHAMGRYEDELVKQNGKWYFSKRNVVVDMNKKWEPDPSPEAR